MSKKFKGKPRDEVTLLDLSSRTVGKILSRMKVKCCVCGWNEAPLDIHHITPRKDGGSDELDNLTPLCPNCHRKAHCNLLAVEEMKSIKELYGESWKDYYYNSENEWKQPLKAMPVKFCPVCQKVLPRFHKTFCSNVCFNKYQEQMSKIPSKDELRHAVETMPITKVGKKYGVSHTQISRWCERLEIDRPKRKSPSKV